MRSLILGLSAALLLAGAADAHPRLVSASPRPNAMVTGSPHEIRVNFSESIIPAMSGVTLKLRSGATVRTGPVSVAAGNPRQMIVPIVGSLRPGNYIVRWHAVSSDTHRIQGQFGFMVH